jgi:hypothetical protein
MRETKNPNASKQCQKIGYRKHPFILIIFLLLSFNKSVKVFWIKAKYTVHTFGAGAALPCCSISFSKSFKRAFRDNFSGLSSWPSSKDGEPAMAARSSAVGTGRPLGCCPTDLAFLAGDDGTFVGLGATCGF